jgi:elongation factor Ts
MAEITAALVKELREKTGAGMMDCKKALQESTGDMEAAADWLRTKGLSAAAKKSGRTASEGVVGLMVEGDCGVAVEINSETDFVARNETFQEFVRNVTKVAVAVGGDLEKLQAADYPGSGRTVAEELTHNIATIGENMSLRRAAGLCTRSGAVVGYVHNRLADGLGKIGVLVALESEGDREQLNGLGRQIAMHVAAARPQWLTIQDVDPAALERERHVLSEQARESGKPEEIIAKMVEGRLRKFYEEAVLLEQIFVMDNETRIAKVLENAAKEVGAPVTLGGFVRFELGEGVGTAADES